MINQTIIHVTVDENHKEEVHLLFFAERGGATLADVHISTGAAERLRDQLSLMLEACLSV